MFENKFVAFVPNEWVCVCVCAWALSMVNVNECEWFNSCIATALFWTIFVCALTLFIFVSKRPVNILNVDRCYAAIRICCPFVFTFACLVWRPSQSKLEFLSAFTQNHFYRIESELLKHFYFLNRLCWISTADIGCFVTSCNLLLSPAQKVFDHSYCV